MSNGTNLFANANRPQRLDRLRACVHGSADLAELWSLLEDLGLDRKSLQRIGCRKPREPTADNGYPTAG
jgi:hypothetical protein